MVATKIKLRKHLNADALIDRVHSCFEKIKDHRPKSTISLSDALMSAFAMFSLKDPSLLAFRKRKSENLNLKSIYMMKNIPCDTQMRTCLLYTSPSPRD